MLINLLRDEQPTHVAAAFDVSRKTFRAELFAAYKAQRSAAPDDFKGQIDLTKDVLGAMGIPVMAIEATRPTTSSPRSRRRRTPKASGCSW